MCPVRRSRGPQTELDHHPVYFSYPHFSPTSSTAAEPRRDESLLLPSQLRTTTSTSTLDSTTSSVDDHSSCGTESGRSTPTPVVANEASHPAVVAALEKRAVPATETSRARAKINNAGAQNRVQSTNSRRSQNSRRGRKTASAIDATIAVANTSVQPPTAPLPSK